MDIGFIGFGSVTAAFMSGFLSRGLPAMKFYKHGAPPPYTGLSAQRMEATGAIFCTPEQLAAECDVIFSCVVGSATLNAASAFAPFLGPRHLYIDLNTASPRVKLDASHIVEATGAAYTDGVIMGPVEKLLHSVPIIASGCGAARFAELLRPLGMDVTALDGPAGQAASVKLIRSIFQKGLAAVLLETTLASRALGVQDVVLGSIFKTFEAVPFRNMAELVMTKAVVHSDRMSKEMSTVLSLLEGENLRRSMTESTLATYKWCAEQKATFSPEGTPSDLSQALTILEKRNVQ